MWNYRIVRKKHLWRDPSTKKVKEVYSYGLYEAYYNDAGQVSAITECSVKPYGDNIEELRHDWMMMADAFGQPVLDYDEIPENDFVNEDEEVIEVGPILRKGLTDSESAALDAELEKKRITSEQEHQAFVQSLSFQGLLKKIIDDYMAKQHIMEGKNKE